MTVAKQVKQAINRIRTLKTTKKNYQQEQNVGKNQLLASWGV